MSLCDTCRVPGACCTTILLNIVFDATRWKADARRIMKAHGWPFYPTRVNHAWHTTVPGNVTVVFECSWLGKDGRCQNYDKRPEPCREYEAGSDVVCAEYAHTFKGIPIRVKTA